MNTTITEASATVKTHLLNGTGNKLPLVAEPASREYADMTHLLDWIKNNHASVRKNLTAHGAILFRNFKVNSALDFEKVALLIDPDLKNDYLGTSPRNKKTDYVFSASELPDFYPISQHCEMSYLEEKPRNLFFYCAVEPLKDGETPIVDFRKVYAQMDPKIRAEFETKGIRNIRNYNGPAAKAKFDLWKLKRWDEMFLTTDKQKVEEICKKQKIEFHWKGDDKLVLYDKHSATIKHPLTGEPVWFNHLQVFHVDSGAIEYGKIAQRQKTMRSYFFNAFISVMTVLKKATTDPEEHAMHCTFLDGSPIPKEYVKHVEDIIWKNMVFFPWRKGDIIAIDNYSTSHGRMPYTGPREIMVCWSA